MKISGNLDKVCCIVFCFLEVIGLTSVRPRDRRIGLSPCRRGFGQSLHHLDPAFSGADMMPHAVFAVGLFFAALFAALGTAMMPRCQSGRM